MMNSNSVYFAPIVALGLFLLMIFIDRIISWRNSDIEHYRNKPLPPMPKHHKKRIMTTKTIVYYTNDTGKKK